MNSKINTKIFKGIIGAALLFVMFIMCGAVVLAEDSAPRTTVQENGTEVVRFDYKSDEVNVKVTLSNPGDLPENAVLSVTPVEITTDMQQKLDEKAVEEQKAIKSAKAYDIKFTVDGKEVEPGATVKVTVTTPEVAAGDTAAVYHVSDDVKTVENMNASTADDGKIAFDTNHFSTYVITNKGTSNIQVTIEHYNSETNKKIYADDVKNLTVGAKINDYKKATNWDVKSIDVTPKSGTTKTYNGDSIADGLNLELTSDTTVKIIYTPASSNIKGDTTFYDYTVKPGADDNNTNQKNSINYEGNYPSESVPTKRIGVGAVSGTNADGTQISGNSYGNVYSNQGYLTTINDGGYNKLINCFSSGTYAYGGNGDLYNAGAIKHGIVKGLDADGNVEFNVDEPGLFSSDTKAGKAIFSNYKLGFSRSGDTYSLNSVYKGDGTTNMITNTSDFFPLDTEEHASSDYDASHNYYFGMRYDIKFTLGDYVGPLDYTFTGDDDLWVLLDGSVVLDIGGIHAAQTGNVDLWTKIKDATGNYDKNKEHTLTVLYMERGGNLSHCNMNFTIPNAQITTVENVPLANLELIKTNTKGEMLEGASFKLAMNGEGNETIQYTASSDAEGKLNFNNLRVGTYTLTESSAPDKYTASDNSWIVDVVANADGVTATATVYVKNADGTQGDVVTDNKIINYTAQEILNKDLESSKTATVKDWNDRTYDINITASSKASSTEETTEGGVADVMLVLDRSGSMSYTLDQATYTAIGAYNEIKNSLDKSTTYYYGDNHLTMTYDKSQGKKYWKVSKTKVDDNSTVTVYKKVTTRMDALKASAGSFLTNMAKNSSQSKVGITSFSSTSYGGGNLDASISTIGTDASSLITTINKLSASGGTMPELGLDLAKQQLGSSKQTGIPQYVILFTDGAPTGNHNYPSDTNTDDWDSKTKTEKAVQDLKDAGVTVFTVGLGLNDTTKNWLNGIASTNCAFTANDAESLQNIFDTIQSTITHNTDISNATVKDYIDTRFDILDDSGNKITIDTKGTDDKNMTDGGSITLDNGGVVRYDSAKKAFYVVWENQTIPNTANTGVQAWSKIITVKAKDNYIGGNAVTTNGADSAITVGTASKPLDQPTVNVKSDFTINNAEETIFWGDTVPLNDAIKAQLIQSALEKFNLSGYAVTADRFEVKLYTEELCSTEITEEMLETLTPDASTNTYYAKVTYNNLGASTAESSAHTNSSISGDATEIGVNSTLTKGPATYTIHVVKGQIQINKSIDSQYSNINKINANQTFVYKIEYYENSLANSDATAATPTSTFYETISFDANGNMTKDSRLISGLKKGYYKVTEETDWSKKYVLESKELGTTELNKQGADNNISAGYLFYIGTKGTDGDNGKHTFSGLEDVKSPKTNNNWTASTKYTTYAGGTRTQVSFVNQNKNWNWLSDTASAINVFNTSK
ncbi:fibro-slime domain-containing protein [Eubacterium aggregans]|uniref:Fibro-slime domain-containing protein n=1 Tax=Eubacterium aggregans TaxID=81409 RepID=A0A1H4AXP3_9FIRM|nr:fibro-slime domain-containing protein [Eubacterium aggregans]SEA40597.1 fibro-slime domain-containing protein [Eubacterium aggregans]